MSTDPLSAEVSFPEWSFFVPGEAVTQGSKTALRTPQGRMIVKESGGDRLKLWCHRISDAASRARGPQPPLTGPVGIELFFWMAKPKAAPKRRRTWPIGARSGDVDKLMRAALDAMTGVLFLDDAQVVHATATKDYAGPQGPGLDVIVRGIA